MISLKTNKEKRYETDLYGPIRDYFVKNGFDVYGEVHHCDLVAVKEEELIIVELKLGLTIDLLIQATKRQRITDLVYVAVPMPKYRLSSKKWQDICHLIRRLELGLILVSFQKSYDSKVELMISPESFDRKKSTQRNKTKRKKLLAEIDGRHGDYNIGGSNKTKIMTAYKENCIHIAYLLNRNGPLSAKRLGEMGTGKKTSSILRENYYDWFDKIQRGIYSISEKGKTELKDFPEQVQHFLDETIKGQCDEREIEK